MKGNVRRNIYLTVKEAIHNIVKHSGATRVHIKIVESEGLFICIKDNGKGMDPAYSLSGNGLKNMQMRINNLEGTIEWQNDGGTSIAINIPLV